MEEPSVLDYLKSKLFFWRKEVIEIPSQESASNRDNLGGGEVLQAVPDIDQADKAFPVKVGLTERRLLQAGAGATIARILVPVGLGLMAQSALEPPGRSVFTGLILYSMALAWLLWSCIKGEWSIPSPPDVESKQDTLEFRQIGFWLFVPLIVLAFLSFKDNVFTAGNVFLWLLAWIAFLYAFWQANSSVSGLWERFRDAWDRFFSQGIRFSPWALLVLTVFFLSAFYRFYQLDQIPAEMFSDHAEKLLDVRNVLNGNYHVYFPRNTGREAFQMYLTAAMAVIFKTGLSFMSLKLGTVFCGLFTLPFIYLLGVEIANRRVGLFAMFFAGIAYWPNVISRVALRFTLYPTFTAPMLYFLLRGIRRRSRNDYILSGIFLGLGLNGYSPYRFVPIIVVATVVLYLLHPQSKGRRGNAVWGLLLLAVSSLIIFVPLLRFWISNPEIFSYRMMTRMGQAERTFPGPPGRIFLENLWKAVIMPVWDNGQIWVHSIPNRPALGVVSAVFFVFGVLILLVRYVKKRYWLDLLMLVLIPLLMMPSILSLAFPDENPSLNRTGGALIVIFIIVGLAFDAMLRNLRSERVGLGGTWLAWFVGAILLVWSANQNYDLVFDQYAQQFRTNAWNTSELGAVIRQFADTAGAEDSAWVVPYPHWVDTRLVGIRAGFPERDYALWPENIVDSLNDPRPKLYLVKPEDEDTIELLRSFYPTGVLRLYESQVEGRDFYMYSVPPVE